MQNLNRYLKGFLALLAIGVFGYFAGTFSDRYQEKKPKIVSHGEAAIGGPFRLITTQGKPFTDQDLLGRYSLIYFGFTHCPDVCPLDMNRISMALSELGNHLEINDYLQPVFISVDPNRDTPDRIAEFLEGYHPAFVGLTGTQEEMETAAKAYKVYWEEILNRDHMGGPDAMAMINHSSYIYLMDETGKYVTHYDSSFPPSKLAEDLKKRLD